MLAQELKAAELISFTCLPVIIIIIAVYRVSTHYHKSAHSVHFSDKYEGPHTKLMPRF